MPQELTYPGVYVEEVPSGVRTIVGVATSITAFVGRARKGRTDRAVTITSYAQFVDQMGGLWADSRLGFAVRDFYLNGGREALICRLYKPVDDQTDAPWPGRARLTVGAGDTTIALVASSPGSWGNGLRATVDQQDLAPGGELFNLTVSEDDGRTERFRGLSLYAGHRRNILDVLERESALVRWDEKTRVLREAEDGKPRTGPPESSDPQTKAAQDRADAAKGAVSAGRVALSGSGTAEDAAKSAKAAEAAKGSAKAAAEKEQEAAKKAEAEAETALTDAEKLVKTIDPSLPANKQKLADAEADVVAKTKLHKDAVDAVTAAVNALNDADRALADAEGAAKGADEKATAAKKAATAAEDAARGATRAQPAAADLGGDDGVDLESADVTEQGKRLLEAADLFNLLCIPPHTKAGGDVEPAVFDDFAAYCMSRRAVLLVDPPEGWRRPGEVADVFRGPVDTVGGRSANSAVYFPRLRQPNPLSGGAMEEFVPCGAVAGVLARTDGARGVWKAGAGLDATLMGVPELTVKLDDAENGLLNPLGINCLRSFPGVGRVVWGARTLVGADALASEWKYLPIRRLALLIEESLYRGTQWVVFEPNDEPLWAQIRLSVGSYMHELFRQGAFQGRSPRDAYFVKCDKETTTEADRNKGIVNIAVGFAPLKPAEFVVIRLQQIAGQIEV